MTITTDRRIADLVTERPSRSRTFQEFGIDFCCGGKRTLAEVCATGGLDTASVVAALEREASAAAPASVDLRTIGLAELCDHIEATHHAFLRRELPRLSQLWNKVAEVHGERLPWTVELATIYAGFREALEQHMQKEEMVLFPAIRGLAAGDRSAGRHCGSVRNPIGMMELEHAEAGEELAQFRRLSDGYTVPADACNTLRAAIAGLLELETDLHAHVHAENYVLFPRAVAAERD